MLPLSYKYYAALYFIHWFIIYFLISHRLWFIDDVMTLRASSGSTQPLDVHD